MFGTMNKNPPPTMPCPPLPPYLFQKMSIKSDDTPESLQDGKPNSELQFQFYVTLQLALFTVSIWLSGLS